MAPGNCEMVGPERTTAAHIPAMLLAYRRKERFENWCEGVVDACRYLSPFLNNAMRQIKPPVELKGLKERLTRARELQARGDAVGRRYDAALNLIEERVNQSEQHAENLERYSDELQETISQMLEGANTAGEDSGPSGQGGPPGP
jgi:hypothetical protein